MINTRFLSRAVFAMTLLIGGMSTSWAHDWNVKLISKNSAPVDLLHNAADIPIPIEICILGDGSSNIEIAIYSDSTFEQTLQMNNSETCKINQLPTGQHRNIAVTKGIGDANVVTVKYRVRWY